MRPLVRGDPPPARCAIIGDHLPATSRPVTASLAPVSDIDPNAVVEVVDASFLQTLLGFNARMAALKAIAVFIPRMAPYGLRIVDFSILSIVHHNPGVTSRQLCDTLNLLPPNLVGKIAALEKRGLLLRHPHPQDGRALGLHLTAEGHAMMQEAEEHVSTLEADVAAALTPRERQTLTRLLRKVYE